MSDYCPEHQQITQDMAAIRTKVDAIHGALLGGLNGTPGVLDKQRNHESRIMSLEECRDSMARRGANIVERVLVSIVTAVIGALTAAWWCLTSSGQGQ